MILEKNLQSVWTKHREKLLAIHYSEQPKVDGLDKLAIRYTDKKGNVYRGWERDADIPTVRYAKVLEFLQYMIKGVSAQEDEKLDNQLLSILEEGVKDVNSKAFARASAIVMERQMRRKMFVHTQLCYDVLAVQIVRQDENPYDFSNPIHLEKVDMLMEENKDGHVDFFFRMHELKRVRDLLGISKEDWQLFLDEYQVKAKRLDYLLKVTDSPSKLKSNDTTSTK